MSKWIVLKRRVGAVTSQRVLKVPFYVNILQCFFVVEHFTANADSVAIGDDVWMDTFLKLSVFCIDMSESHNLQSSAVDRGFEPRWVKPKTIKLV
jgi:hypothetical protein